ncbi:phage tail tube protein [Vibrio sp. 1636]|uniref:Phage tail protein n=1 Tax=Vibrio alginolyticus TaxID=663 RepID=A0A7Y0MZI6_VIBAL|nr:MULTISPECIES: phage tail tube protein [Vibrio]MDW2204323.1 phage tail tube protein [Vibrio sp. 1636]NMR76258.1 phage tail protein [Vibrio alginolyticus]
MAATHGMIPVAGKGNTVSILKQGSTIEQALAAGEEDDTNWDLAGYLSGITPVNMTKEVNTEIYLDSEDGYAKKSTGMKDAGDFSFQLGYAPGLAVQKRIVDIYDVANGEAEKTYFRVKSPTEVQDKYAVNIYYGPISSLGVPSSIENSTDMKRDITVAVEGRPNLAEDFLHAVA